MAVSMSSILDITSESFAHIRIDCEPWSNEHASAVSVKENNRDAKPVQPRELPLPCANSTGG